VLATALVASIADPKAFRSGRNFSAWIGLVPPLQNPASYNLEQVMQQVREMKASSHAGE
jgi:transposase